MRSIGVRLSLIVFALMALSDRSHSGGANDAESGGEEPVVAWPQPTAPKPADPERLKDEAAIAATKPVYKGESRKDWGELKDPRVQARARASVALYFEALQSVAPGRLKSSSSTLSEKAYVCTDERFANQLSSADCSGTLIGEDVVLTAGHCVQEYRADCEDDPVPFAKDIHFVFGYRSKDGNDKGPDTFESRMVFRGKKALGGACKVKGGDDWALVQLDRKVPSTIAVPVREISKSKIDLQRSLYVLGYPSGLPLKLAGDAKVLTNTARAFFIADLDTFGGNSGSGVYNAESHDLVGILVRGAADYYVDQKKDCRRPYRCKSVVKRPENGNIVECSGEDVTRVEIVKMP